MPIESKVYAHKGILVEGGPTIAAMLLQIRRDLMHVTRLDVQPMPGAEQIVSRLVALGPVLTRRREEHLARRARKEAKRERKRRARAARREWHRKRYGDERRYEERHDDAELHGTLPFNEHDGYEWPADGRPPWDEYDKEEGERADGGAHAHRSDDLPWPRVGT